MERNTQRHKIGVYFSEELHQNLPNFVGSTFREDRNCMVGMKLHRRNDCQKYVERKFPKEKSHFSLTEITSVYLLRSRNLLVSLLKQQIVLVRLNYTIQFNSIASRTLASTVYFMCTTFRMFILHVVGDTGMVTDRLTSLPDDVIAIKHSE